MESNIPFLKATVRRELARLRTEKRLLKTRSATL